MTAAIRHARSFDLDALVAIEKTAFASDRISRASFARLLRVKTATVLVADAEGSVIGYALLLFHKARRAARLYSLAIDGARADPGTGRSLLKGAEDHALGHGANELRLEVRSDNRRAIALYERSGYRRVGVRPDYYADGAMALRYARTLAGEGKLK